MSRDFVIEQHKEWLGYLQSDSSGLVVAPAALKAAQIQVDKNIFELNSKLQAVLARDGSLPEAEYKNLLKNFFEWRDEDNLSSTDVDWLVLPEYHETVKPTLNLVRDAKTIAYVLFVPEGKHFDDEFVQDGSRWEATYQQKFERLLRDKDISVGILVGNSGIRLTYAPKQETSGYLTFPFSVMTKVEGRSALSACHKLLSAWTIFYAPEASRLTKVLEESRKYQNTVSIELSGQVLSALYELVRGFDEAHRITQKSLLAEALETDPNLIYKGLLIVLLRSVFLLYAEDRDVLFNSKGETRKTGAEVFKNHYSINALYEQLRSDAAIHLDTMGQRFGAWGRLLSLFRAVYEGVEFEGFELLGRKGHLFDPERFQFLEGRDSRQTQFKPPPISDSTVFKVLSFLMTLDGERISYRTLDVEQIGSVYETVMGFRLEVAGGPSVAIRPKKAHGAPVVINLTDLLAVPAKDRPKWLKENTDQDEKSEPFKAADSIDSLVAALDRRIARQATPDVAPIGSLVLQPSPERRKTGSHYTPRSLTEPIVRKSLEPIFYQLGERPTPEQILNLKICDPSMGSGAFLVEVCRQLADALVRSWAAHGAKLSIPPDETELLYAQRIVARKCLYGVDKNPMAVDLAKLSLWLATFASDHEFTFLDHNLKCGDSLVGLSLSQILAATWENGPSHSLPHASIAQRLSRVREVRSQISNAADDASIDQLRLLKNEEDVLLNDLRCIGDGVIYSYFAKDKPRARKEELNRINLVIESWFASGIPFCEFNGLNSELDWLRVKNQLRPFHWECEFPEVFSDPSDGAKFGFDGFVGNPPFAGKNTIINSNLGGYLNWLGQIHTNSHGNADLVAHFYRRSFSLLRSGGVFGLIATNTISQGDTRSTGLLQILQNNGEIFSAVKRLRWPGDAAVVVSVVFVSKAYSVKSKFIDNNPVRQITAFLFENGPSVDPQKLRRNQNKSYQGSIILGMGFTFDDADSDGVASTISDMNNLVTMKPALQERIFPYLGGEEVNKNPTHTHHRYVFNLSNFDYEGAQSKYPELLKIAEDRVRPDRLKQKDISAQENWWKFLRPRDELYLGLANMNRCLVVNCGATPHMAFTFLPSGSVFAHTLAVFLINSYQAFAVLQSRIHEVWVRFMGSSMKDDLRYTPTDCFETFPFPPNFEENSGLEVIGRQYFEFRRDLMIQNDEGMTKTYNRFHDTSEDNEAIKRLREIQNQLDLAVLAAYGWTDMIPHPEFLADYDDEDGDASYRLKWPDNVRDQILARLMDLNARYAAEEAAQGDEE